VAELTVLEEKLAEVLGLAMAAKVATDKVSRLTEEPQLSSMLLRMHAEADETESRCTDIAGGLTMAEAGEVGHWSVLRKLNERAGRDDLQELVDWALPIQERHFHDALAGAVELAGEEGPDEAS
jgi:hypothetical protein